MLDEVAGERQREVPACRVALEDDVLRREAHDIHEIAIPRERVQQSRREGVALGEGRGGRQPVLHGERALDKRAAVLQEGARDARGEVRRVRGEAPVRAAVEAQDDLLAGRGRRADRGGALGPVEPVPGDAGGLDALRGRPDLQLIVDQVGDGVDPDSVYALAGYDSFMVGRAAEGDGADSEGGGEVRKVSTSTRAML